jgi:hypothetical protein
MVQVHVGATPWRFDSSSGHQARPQSTPNGVLFLCGFCATGFHTTGREKDGAVAWGMRRLPSFALIALGFSAGLLPGCAACGPVQQTCTNDADCGDDAFCTPSEDGTIQVCAEACDAQNPCPDEMACVDVDGAFRCLAITGEIPIDESCDSDTACETGACVGDPGFERCAPLCVDNDGCGDGERCYQIEQRRVCLPPIDDRIAGESCETPRQCDSGYCVATPQTTGAVCVVDCLNAACEGEGQVCARLDNGAEVCVLGGNDGEACTTPETCVSDRCVVDTDGDAICTRGCDYDCDPGWACVPDADDALVCMPLLETRAPQTPCASARQCASGLCVHFDTGTVDHGDLCAVRCGDSGACFNDTVCWETSVGPDVCGPIP